MAKRMFFMLAVVIVVVAGLGFFKYRQIQTAIAMGSSFAPPPSAVTTVVAKSDNWPSTLDVIGTTAAIQGVTVSADLPGTVSRINFESGQSVHAGDVLVELDTREERAQLAAAESDRDLAKINYARDQQLVNEGVVARMQSDNSSAQQKSTEAKVGEIKATIQRKTIRAPFSGVLGIRQINLGQYLAAGAAIVSLQALDPIYVNFGVPQQQAPLLKTGRILELTSDDVPGVEFKGRVTAIDSVVNEATRNLQVQATLPNPGGKLRPGMFVQVQLGLGSSQNVIPLPASAINYAPYGDSVYVVTDMKDPKGKTYRGVRQQFVKLQGSRGDQVGVISGVNPGDEVVSSGVFKLRNGAAVQVNNKVQPPNNPKPNPEDS
ncbi:MAG TPA: efflux RND transporter periplasmic adaptor subunit [Terriglobales bacterium]|jgi:membrane fusion protein (multidrug efflux system)|nr:efflux RND transporter periplasmic adaptor subunit [Terriglobales bacterium]